jgi:hypothetical protein
MTDLFPVIPLEPVVDRERQPTPGPWRVVAMGELRGVDRVPSFYKIVGPKGEKIADIFFHPSVNPIGHDQARDNADWIASNAPARRA